LPWKWKIQLDNIKHCYTVAENEQQKHLFLIDATTKAHSINFYFQLKSYAQLEVEILIASIDIAVNIECILEGEGAHARIIGGYIGSSSHHIKIQTLQHHQEPHTTSELIMKGALYDNACAEYNGMIIIEQKALKSRASQENKNILLSNNARAISVPNLQVSTHEVQCFHGSAVGRLDKQHLLYSAARGIDENRARQLLVHGFFADLFLDSMLKKRISALIGL
jgi:Fe-S cluster assembly scaffold protein SufB